MIRMTVLYPSAEGTRFDLGYYLSSHMPLVRELFGSALLRDEVWTGAGDLEDRQATAPYRVLLHMYYADRATFDAAFATVGEPIVADIPKFTDSTPVIQFDAPAE